MTYLLRRLLIAFLAPLFLFSCDSSERAAEKEVIVFGVSPFQDTLVPLIGEELGWYEDIGLEVEFRILGWTEIQEGMSSRAESRLDVGINNISSVIATHSRNDNIVYYYGFNTFDNGFAIMIRPDGKFMTLDEFLGQGMSRGEAIAKAAAQLRGATVVTTANTDMEQGVAAAAERGGLDFMEDVSIIDMPPDEGLAAFLSGAGDAYIGGIPQRITARRAGMAEMLSGLDLGPAPINGLVTTRDFAEKNSDVLLKLIHVWFKSVQYIEKNPEEGARIIVETLNRNSGANFTVEEFLLYFDEYETFFSSPAMVQREILDPQGRNYWKTRWDDTNRYFVDIKKTVPEYVSADDAFMMIDAHRQYVLKYGQE